MGTQLQLRVAALRISKPRVTLMRMNSPRSSVVLKLNLTLLLLPELTIMPPLLSAVVWPVVVTTVQPVTTGPVNASLASPYAIAFAARAIRSPSSSLFRG